MTTINNVSNVNYFKKRPNQAIQSNQTKTTTVPSKKKVSTPVIVATTAGATALASLGIYYVTKGRVKSNPIETKPQIIYENMENVFEKVKNTDSIMGVLKDTKLLPKKFKELMFKITSDEGLGEKFIKEVTVNPRKSKENVQILNQNIGGDKELIDWMLRPNGYQDAYTKHTKKLVQDAKHPDDLIKQSPNWTIWKLKNKFKDDFCFGELPKTFSNNGNNEVDNYRNIFNEALHHQAGFEKDGIKFGEYLGGGMSGKAVRRVDIGDKKYILKFQSNVSDDISMKSDSTFLNAQLERYLTLNDYHQGPKLKFYDAKTNSALYEMSEGAKTTEKEIADILDVNKQLNGLEDIGVYYNDVGVGNFLKADGKLNFIDSGESSFVDFFKPGVEGYHFSLPNLNGKSITDSAAAINLAK